MVGQIGLGIFISKHQELGQFHRFEINSAGSNATTNEDASENAKKAIKQLYGQDLLEDHKSKKLTTELKEETDLILAMTGVIKNMLPQDKSWTLREYAGSSGDIKDPIGTNPMSYLMCAQQISNLMVNIVEKLTGLSESEKEGYSGEAEMDAGKINELKKVLHYARNKYFVFRRLILGEGPGLLVLWGGLS